MSGLTIEQIAARIDQPVEKVRKALTSLEKKGLVTTSTLLSSDLKTEKAKNYEARDETD